MRKIFLFISVLAIAALLAGCNPSKEKEEFENSLGILYPITKIGQGIAAIGSSISSISQPKIWIQRRPEKVSGIVSKEQDAYLKDISVTLDMDKEFRDNEYLGPGTKTYGPSFKTMVFRIEKTAGMRFDWKLSPVLPQMAAAYPGGVIVVNPKRLRIISAPGQYIAIFHEVGHHALNHTGQFGPVKKLDQPWLSQANEKAADIYAGEAMKKAGFSIHEITYGAIDAFKKVPEQGTDRLNSRSVRILTVKTAAGG